MDQGTAMDARHARDPDTRSSADARDPDTRSGAGVRFLLVDSCGRWAAPAARRFPRTALALAESGAATTLLLIQDAVSHAVGADEDIAALVKAGARVWVDRPSLERRGLVAAALADGVEPSSVEEACELFLDPATRVVWH